MENAQFPDLPQYPGSRLTPRGQFGAAVLAQESAHSLKKGWRVTVKTEDEAAWNLQSRALHAIHIGD